MTTSRYTEEDKLLLQCQIDSQIKMKQLIEIGRPYVWELRLSQEQFIDIESKIAMSISSHSDDYRHLLCEDFAVIVVIYIAEWYKRFYKGAATADENKISLSTEELKRLYAYAKIDSNTFVYNASKNPDKTSFRWLESLQVLGGMAVQAELRKEENDTLLAQLCKIFHGEDIEIDNLKDRNIAIAFQESISRQHSLYEYLDCILNKEKEMPFAKADMDDETTMIPLFIERIQNADREAKKDKFDFEWIITYTASCNQMVRSLKVKLKPEVIGGGRKQYIGYDRLKTSEWSVESPENVGRLEFYIRFKNGRHIISTSHEPLFKYHNTGNETTGFLSVGRLDEAIYNDVPIERFDKVEIVLKYDNVSKVVQTLMVEDYMQVYALRGTANKFSSRRNSQATTAVVFSSAYQLADSFKDQPIVYAHYRNKEKTSEDYCWCPINDKIVLVDPEGKEIMPPFFNRNGLYQVVTKKYLRTIKYNESTFVLYKYIDADLDDDEMQDDYLPVLFGRQGLEVRYYETRNAKEAIPIADYDLEWMKNGHYVDWNKEEPTQGVHRLRITVKGIVFNLRVYYVPFIPTEYFQEPIWRDFENRRICTALSGVKDIDDNFEMLLDKREDETRQLEIGSEDAKILIDVYRPVILRELSQQGRIVSYFGKNENIEIPLINCHQFSLRDFSESGVKEYKLGASDTAFYGFTTFNDPAMASTNYTEVQMASKIFPNVPLEYLKIYITKAIDQESDLWAWNYKDKPQKVSSANELKGEGVVFQSLMENRSPRHYSMPVVKKSGWGGKNKQIDTNVLDCFITADKHKTYFFLFIPLIKCVHERRMIKDIILPILLNNKGLEEYNNYFGPLYRFAMQFHFDWMLLPRSLWISEINAYAKDEDEKIILKNKLVQFFENTHKATDERESFCLREFLDKYWTFNKWPSIDGLANTALSLIFGETEALNKYGSMKDFLKVYDECRFKFSEMSKVVIVEN